MKYLTLVLLLLVNTASANMIGVEELSLSYKNFFQGGRDPLITYNGLPNKRPAQELGLNMNLSLFGFVYWDNLVHTMTDKDMITDSSQFRTVGWQFRFGIRPVKWLEVGYYHHSEHVLDTIYAPDGKAEGFPVRDAFEIKLNFLSTANKQSIF